MAFFVLDRSQDFWPFSTSLPHDGILTFQLLKWKITFPQFRTFHVTKQIPDGNANAKVSAHLPYKPVWSRTWSRRPSIFSSMYLQNKRCMSVSFQCHNNLQFVQLQCCRVKVLLSLYLRFSQFRTQQPAVGKEKSECIAPSLLKLQLLPIKFCVDYKVLLETFSSLNGIAPGYCADLRALHTAQLMEDDFKRGNNVPENTTISL